jgi:Ca2+-binding RTX toxin-like protein
MGGAPDGSSTYFQIDFSKQDEDPRPNFGLFRGALLSATVAGSATNPDVVPWASQVGDGSTKTFSANPLILFNNTNGGASYRAGDLISFKNAEGKTEFRGILFSPDKYVLCLGFVTTPDDNTLPNSLTSLKAAMTLNGGVYPVRFIGSQSDAQDFLSGRKTLESLEVQKLGNPSNKGNLQYFVSFGEASYTMRSDQQDYTSLGLNPSGYPDRGASDSFSFSIYGNDLNNTITITGNKSSKLYGGGGNDTLYGGDGNDELYGGAGNDRLYGSDGADTLNGYSNQRSSTVVNDVSQIDTLTGGSGSDTFVLGEGNTPYYVGAKDSYAIITDWQPGIDRLQIASVPGGQYIAESRNVIGDARLDTEIYYINGNIRDRVAILQDIQDNNPFAGHQ